MIHIGLQSEYVLSIFGFMVTNTFLTSIVVTLLLFILAVIYYLNRDNHKNIIIKGVRAVIFGLLKFIDSVTEDRELSKRVFPLVATFFVFICAANLLGLLPGFLGSFFVQVGSAQMPLLKSPNSDLTITLALALVSVFATQYFSVSILGIKKYIGRFINFTNPINFILGFFEMLSETARLVSFSFRLFGNIFAGELLLFVVAFLIPYVLPLPFMILEVFVGIIQAFIFATLTLTFVQASTLRFEGS